MVKEFWAVTTSNSLYHAVAERDETGTAVVHTVADRRYVGNFHERVKLKGGSNVGIVDDLAGLCLFNPESTTLCAIEQSVGYWGGHTTQLTALFLTLDKARSCFEAGKSGHWAESWLAFSLETVFEIATGHEIFRLDPAVCERFGLKPIRQCPYCSLVVSGALMDGHIDLKHADILAMESLSA